MKYVRGDNGVIFDYNELFEGKKGFTILTEEEAFPENFAPVDLKTREKKVDLEVAAEVVTPPTTSPELAAQKGETFSEKRPMGFRSKKFQSPTPFDAAGLAKEF